MPPKRHLHKFDADAATTATATAIPTAAAAAAVTLPHLPKVFMAISCVVSVGSLRQPRLVGRSKFLWRRFHHHH